MGVVTLITKNFGQFNFRTRPFLSENYCPKFLCPNCISVRNFWLLMNFQSSKSVGYNDMGMFINSDYEILFLMFF